MPDKDRTSKHKDERMQNQPDPTMDHRDPARDEVSTPDKSAPMGHIKNEANDDLDGSELSEKVRGESPGNEVEKMPEDPDEDPDKNDKNK